MPAIAGRLFSSLENGTQLSSTLPKLFWFSDGSYNYLAPPKRAVFLSVKLCKATLPFYCVSPSFGDLLRSNDNVWTGDMELWHSGNTNISAGIAQAWGLWDCPEKKWLLNAYLRLRKSPHRSRSNRTSSTIVYGLYTLRITSPTVWSASHNPSCVPIMFWPGKVRRSPHGQCTDAWSEGFYTSAGRETLRRLPEQWHRCKFLLENHGWLNRVLWVLWFGICQ